MVGLLAIIWQRGVQVDREADSCARLKMILSLCGRRLVANANANAN
jgi:hypothetical protein